LNDTEAADCGASSVTVPAEPVKIASDPADQGTSLLPLNQLLDVFHVPVPPSPAPVDVLSPAAVASASQ
jgi:hypothetical protein